MSLENSHLEVAAEYLQVKVLQEKMGFEVVGINPQKKEDYYVIRKKKHSPAPTSG